MRCVEGPDGLTPLPDQGSHAVTSLAGATALAWVGEDDDGGRRARWSRFSPAAPDAGRAEVGRAC